MNPDYHSLGTVQMRQRERWGAPTEAVKGRGTEIGVDGD